MGYIMNLEKELEKRLAGLEEERKKKLIRFIKLCVLESYRNGIMSVKMTKADKEADRKTKELSEQQ